MNVLLVYPQYPTTFWSFKHALKFVSKKAAFPPLGLLTVASMLPENWNKKLIDMNVEKLNEKDIKKADYVLISAMAIQKKSVKDIIHTCKANGTKVIAGGPLFTASHEDFYDVDHFILNEAEVTLPFFLEDLKNNCTKRVYTSNEFPSVDETPIPSWDLIKMKYYSSMSIQYSRGCPFNCEFCDITTLFGRKVRTKNKDQIIKELEDLYIRGWRSSVFFVDDNFIGNKIKLKQEILPAIIHWIKKRKYPFTFFTEASINLSDDEELLSLMVDAGFNSVFVGIESPDEASLAECNKFQNKNRDLVKSVKKIQRFGLEVTGGFIVGFDSDSPLIFNKQIEFIKKSRIVTAMVGLLNAPKNTPLYHRLKKENRLLRNLSGDNTDFSINFIPKMDPKKLMGGYKKIIKEIYSVKPYYERVRAYLKGKKFSKERKNNFQWVYLNAFFKTMIILGIKEKGRFQYWKLVFWSCFRSPRSLPKAITMAVYGYHFRKVFAAYL